MNKLVNGVGVNDLGYRTQAYEEVTKKWRQKRSTKKVFSWECRSVADAVYLCIIEHSRKGKLIELPEKYARQWLGWAV